MIQENKIGNTNNKFQVKFETELHSETDYVENGIYFLKYILHNNKNKKHCQIN